MANESSVITVAELRRVHEDIATQGFALTTESDIGLPVRCAAHLRGAYFDSGQLRHDEGDYPEDRERARDVVCTSGTTGS